MYMVVKLRTIIYLYYIAVHVQVRTDIINMLCLYPNKTHTQFNLMFPVPPSDLIVRSPSPKIFLKKLS